MRVVTHRSAASGAERRILRLCPEHDTADIVARELPDYGGVSRGLDAGVCDECMRLIAILREEARIVGDRATVKLCVDAVSAVDSDFMDAPSFASATALAKERCR